MQRGEVWWANLPEPWGRRPVLLLSRNQAYELLNGAIAAPLTTKLRSVPTMVRLEPREDGVPRTCVVNLDALQFVLFSRLSERITLLGTAKMRHVEDALRFALELQP